MSDTHQSLLETQVRINARWADPATYQKPLDFESRLESYLTFGFHACNTIERALGVLNISKALNWSRCSSSTEVLIAANKVLTHSPLPTPLRLLIGLLSYCHSVGWVDNSAWLKSQATDQMMDPGNLSRHGPGKSLQVAWGIFYVCQPAPSLATFDFLPSLEFAPSPETLSSSPELSNDLLNSFTQSPLPLTHFILVRGLIIKKLSNPFVTSAKLTWNPQTFAWITLMLILTLRSTVTLNIYRKTKDRNCYRNTHGRSFYKSLLFEAGGWGSVREFHFLMAVTVQPFYISKNVKIISKTITKLFIAVRSTSS